MKPAIYFEAKEFLEATGMSASALCREAGIPSVTLSRILNGERQDMVSANADKLRLAMWRLGRRKRKRGGRAMNSLFEPCVWLASALAWAGILAALAWIWRERMHQQRRRPRAHRRIIKRRMR